MPTYELEKYLLPIYEGDTVYYETGLIVGETGEITLLYHPDRILGVYDYGLQRELLPGRDYTVEGRTLKRVREGSLPYLPREEFYREQPAAVTVRAVRERCPDYCEGREYLYFGEKDMVTRHQIAVSYTHSDPWPGHAPEGKPERFAALYARCRRGERVRILFYGDSITTGCNSSGMPAGGQTPPYAEPFPVMVTRRLSEVLGVEVEYRNTAVAGWSVRQGWEAREERLLAEPAELLVLGFGMNDSGTPVEDFAARTEALLLAFREKNPQAEVVLLSSTLPNVESDWWCGRQLQQEQALLALEAK